LTETDLNLFVRFDAPVCESFPLLHKGDAIRFGILNVEWSDFVELQGDPVYPSFEGTPESSESFVTFTGGVFAIVAALPIVAGSACLVKLACAHPADEENHAEEECAPCPQYPEQMEYRRARRKSRDRDTGSPDGSDTQTPAEEALPDNPYTTSDNAFVVQVTHCL
jgi:hypothetical protein